MNTTASILLNKERLGEDECQRYEPGPCQHADEGKYSHAHPHSHGHHRGRTHGHEHAHQHTHLRPLTLAGLDGPVCVGGMRGNDDLKRRLCDLGFAPGGEVRVISELGGNLIVDVKGSRVALDRKLAQKIMVV